MSSTVIRCISFIAVLLAFLASSSGKSMPDVKANEEIIPRVQNGSIVTRSRRRWMVALLKGDVILGSASLISKKTAITSARVLVHVDDVSEIHGRIGNVQWRRGRIVNFSEIKVHEDFDTTISLNLNDIALLILQEEVQISWRVKTIALPLDNAAHVGTVSFAGWGSCHPEWLGQSDSMKMVTWNIHDYRYTPDELLRLNPLMIDTFIWAKSVKGNAPCPGDYGGPLVYGQGTGTLCIGVLSSRRYHENADEEFYLAISTGYYVNWIRRNAIGEIRFIQ